jgi:hypothetical protein
MPEKPNPDAGTHAAWYRCSAATHPRHQVTFGRRLFIVRADEKLTAFVELERAIHEFAVSLLS